MRFSFTIAVLALASAVCAAPASAVMHTPGSHVNVNTCLPHKGKHEHVRHYMDAFGNWQTAMQPGRPSTLEIHYINTAHVAAKEIDFGLVAKRSMVATVKDVGTFSTGILIDHEFGIPHEVFPLGTGLPQCAVLKVVYADGSVWNNPNPPQP